MDRSCAAGLFLLASVLFVVSACATPSTGVRSGYVEGHTFDDDSDTVIITLESATADSVTGYVRFGDREPITR